VQALTAILAPARTLPTTRWSARSQRVREQRPLTIAVLLLGLWLFGTGEAGLVNARLGNTPWTVLAQGVANRTSFDIGTATIVISVLVLAGWIPLRQRPGIGTLANVVVIGVGIEVMTRVLPQPSNLAARIVEAALAIVIVGLGSALYLTANLGPGPRDGWMTGLHRRSGWPLASVRAAIELTVLAIGYALGGNAGVATFAFALLVGYCLTLTLRLFGDVAWIRASSTAPITPARSPSPGSTT
jgi:hypothetical protein